MSYRTKAAHILWLGDPTRRTKIIERNKKLMTSCLALRSIHLHCLADPRPVASDLFMILSFLQVLVNILQKYSKDGHQHRKPLDPEKNSAYTDSVAFSHSEARPSCISTCSLDRT